MGKSNSSNRRIEIDALPERNNITSKNINVLENSSGIQIEEIPMNVEELSLLSISSAAKLLQVGKRRIYNLIDTNQLRIIDFGGTIKIPYFELKKCLESLSKYSPSKGYSTKRNEFRSIVESTPKDIIRKIKESRVNNE